MRSVLAATSSALLLLALSACAGLTGTAPAPTPQHTIAGMFASEAEALDAATKLLSDYRNAMDQIGSEGAAQGYEALKPHTTLQGLQTEMAGFEDMKANGYSVSGTTTFDSLRLTATTELSLDIAFCSDVSGIRVLSGGIDVTRSERDTRLPRIAHLLNQNQNLLINGFDSWTGNDFCG